MNEKEEKKPQKSEKSENPMMKLFTDVFIKPNYMVNMFFRQIGKQMGIQNPIDHFVIRYIEDPSYYTMFRQLYDYKVINDRAIPKTGPVILACNHQSILDPIVAGLAVVHCSGRIPYQLAKIELKEDPWLGVFTDMNQSIYIKRGENDADAIERCKTALVEEQRPLIIYPEGTYGNGGRNMIPFKTGVVRLAWDTNVTILPMCIWGIDKIFVKGMSFPNLKGKLRVKFGEEIKITSLIPNKKDQPTYEEFQKAANELQKIVLKLWETIEEEEYGTE